jgi:predicted adenylyl cyclase CyaB
MPSNIEIKARVADPAQTASLAAALSDGPPQTIFQRDTFFRCSTGRLKLREFASGAGELISYIRADVAGVKQSHYEIVPVADAKALQALLHQALGETVVVEKTRRLYRVGQTRVHLDAVQGLGAFLELEVVMRPGQAAAEGHAIAADLMRRLGIHESDLLATAYADMLADAVAHAAAMPHA